MRRPSLRVVLRYPRPRSPLAAFVSGSVGAHALAIAAIVLVPGLHRKPPIREDVWVVGLAAPSLPGPAASAAAPSAARAPAAPAPSDSDGARLETREETPSEAAVRKEEKKKEPDVRKEAKAPEGGPAPMEGPSLPPGGAPGGGPGGSPGIPGAGLGSIVAAEFGDAQFAWYRASVIALFQSRWIRPVLEGDQGTLTVTVTFDIESDGTVRNVAVDASSGVPSLDRSAIRAVEEASPLPPLPPSWGHAPFHARFEFRYTP